SPALAQNAARPLYGLFGQYAINNHSANFQNLPDAFSCGANYTSGRGGGFSIGALYEVPFADAFKMSLRASYLSDNATLRSSENQLLGINGEAQNGTFEKTLGAEISTIGLEPSIGYQLYRGLNLHAGARIGFLMQKAYEQKEQIVNPGNAVFSENQTRTRNQSSGDISGTSALQAALLGGLSYDIPLNAEATFIASPEIFYSFGLTSFVSGLNWTGNALRAGVSFKMSPAASHPVLAPPTETPIPVTPTPPPVPPVLTARLDAVGVLENGTEVALTSIVVEEFLRRQSQPLLPYIFFDDNSAEIPVRYNRITAARVSEYSLNQLYSLETIKAYHEILNIIGKRLRDNPSANITLSGHNSNTGNERNNVNLSRQRAENIKNYLTSVWDIPSSRISVQARNLPSSPSNTQEPDGIEENRRVEITSSSPHILSPIVLNDTLRTVSPQAVRFKTNVQSGAGIENWNITLTGAQGYTVKQLTGTGSISGISDIRTDEIASALPSGRGAVIYTLEARDNVGQIFKTDDRIIALENRTIDVKHRESGTDKEIENYSLMLFEFDKADLSAENERITRSIKSSIKPGANITVTGYTDRFGDENYNLRLSENRARNVARILGISTENARGLGENVLLYDNTLPEGRFYSRTINITVETPIVK
ncbi:MAG TPA: OmpA family protein, partial [Patescibacteria group bacterium]|nr:OmpA family protein [Patescibacteria group bacterium]